MMSLTIAEVRKYVLLVLGLSVSDGLFIITIVFVFFPLQYI